MALQEVDLAFFLTKEGSLVGWEANGSFEREVALYRRLRPHLRRLHIVSYGGRDERRLATRLPDTGITCNAWGVPGRLYRGYLTTLLPRRWKRRTIVKSNQVAGADVALKAARRGGQPFIARCGYLASFVAERLHGADSQESRALAGTERYVFGDADAVVVTAQWIRERIIDRYELDATKVRVIPNYVDTDTFRPGPERPPTGRIAFVGRLEREKNLLVLPPALAGTGLSLDVIGDGSYRAPLEAAAKEHGVPIRFHGFVPNERLPDLLRACDAFVLPSLFEGHPKSLLEAMACGVPVVGSDVTGIQEILQHRRTGLLAPPTAEGFRDALLTFSQDAALRRHLGAAGREFIESELSLERVVEKELALLRELAEA